MMIFILYLNMKNQFHILGSVSNHSFISLYLGSVFIFSFKSCIATSIIVFGIPIISPTKYNIVANFIVFKKILLNYKRFTAARNLAALRPIIEDVNSHPLYVYCSIYIPIYFSTTILAFKNSIR